MFHGINDIRVGEVPKPQAGTGEAVIWISYHLSTASIFKLFAVLRDINSPDRHMFSLFLQIRPRSQNPFFRSNAGTDNTLKIISRFRPPLPLVIMVAINTSRQPIVGMGDNHYRDRVNSGVSGELAANQFGQFTIIPFRQILLNFM